MNNPNSNCKKIIAFDFDGTLTTFNVPGRLSKMKSTYPSLINNFFDDAIKLLIDDIGLDKIFSELVISNKFLEMISNMKKKGIRIIIMSYGYKKIIEKLLKAKGYHDLFELIITPQDFNLKEGYDQTNELDGKNVMLDKVSKIYGVHKDNIMLVDDSYENIRRAYRNNYNILHVDSGRGLTLDMLDIINKFI